MRQTLHGVWRYYRWEGCVFITALALRLFYLWQSSSGPAFTVPVIDAKHYHGLALALMRGEPVTADLFWQPLFYPLWLGCVYRIWGASLAAVKLLQACVDAGTCLLTCMAGRRILGRGGGIIAGLIMALYGPAIFFSGELLATCWATFWAAALLLMLTVHHTRPSLPLTASIGLCGGLSVLTRPSFLPFFLCVVVWLVARLWKGGPAKRRVLPHGALLAAGLLCTLLPAGVARKKVLGEFGFLPTSGAINLYIITFSKAMDRLKLLLM